MKLMTPNRLLEAQIAAIKDTAEDFENSVIHVFKERQIDINVKDKLQDMLLKDPTLDITHSSLIRQVQSAVKRAFDVRNDHEECAKFVCEAMELLGMSVVVLRNSNVVQNVKVN